MPGIKNKIKRYQNYAISIDFQTWKILFAINADGLLYLAKEELVILKVTASLPAVIHAVLQKNMTNIDLTIEGDARSAQLLSYIMENLRWNPELELAQWLGPLPARLLYSLFRHILRNLDDRWQSLRENSLEFLVYEKQLILGQHELQDFTQHIHSTLQRLTRLERDLGVS